MYANSNSTRNFALIGIDKMISTPSRTEAPRNQSSDTPSATRSSDLEIYRQTDRTNGGTTSAPIPESSNRRFPSCILVSQLPSVRPTTYLYINNDGLRCNWILCVISWWSSNRHDITTIGCHRCCGWSISQRDKRVSGGDLIAFPKVARFESPAFWRTWQVHQRRIVCGAGITE